MNYLTSAFNLNNMRPITKQSTSQRASIINSFKSNTNTTTTTSNNNNSCYYPIPTLHTESNKSSSSSIYSRKVFVGGLPPDLDQGILTKKKIIKLNKNLFQILILK